MPPTLRLPGGLEDRGTRSPAPQGPPAKAQKTESPPVGLQLLQLTVVRRRKRLGQLWIERGMKDAKKSKGRPSTPRGVHSRTEPQREMGAVTARSRAPE